MKGIFKQRDFHSLSVTDLLDAREAYHVHLAHLENVVGTAIGLYRIREQDPDADDPQKEADAKSATPRTLFNSVVKKWSWPCILVFVDKWLSPKEFAKKIDEVVPSRLYLPDGRVVPTCVIFAERQLKAPPPARQLHFPTGLIGGGYPVLTDVQGQEHIGSVGCLVTDGDSVYALSSRHVVGEPGREVYTLMHGLRERIGTSHRNQVGKLAFSEVYPGWTSLRTFVNLDAGLIRVDDLRAWTAQVFGIGELDTPIDLNVDTLSLDLIGCPVRAFGGASGQLSGEIQALFYRYKSAGGFDYVADLLIGPRDHTTPVATRPGDSGTLWFWDTEADPEDRLDKQGEGPQERVIKVSRQARQLRPIAVQWGGHSLMEPGGQAQMQFALATSLGTICRVLDVEVVRDWDIGLSEFWGKVGHYKIGSKACELVSDPKLSRLMLANFDRIGVSDDAIKNGELPMNNSPDFVALADVPYPSGTHA